jgi:hypothetical protein
MNRMNHHSSPNIQWADTSLDVSMNGDRTTNDPAAFLEELQQLQAMERVIPELEKEEKELQESPLGHLVYDRNPLKALRAIHAKGDYPGANADKRIVVGSILRDYLFTDPSEWPYLHGLVHNWVLKDTSIQDIGLSEARKAARTIKGRPELRHGVPIEIMEALQNRNNLVKALSFEQFPVARNQKRQ